MNTDFFVKVRGILHIPEDDINTLCGKEYFGDVEEMDINKALKQRCCKSCFSDYGSNVKEYKHERSAKPDKRRTPLATW